MQENPPQKNNPWMIVAKIFRFLFGAALVIFIVIGLPTLIHESPYLILNFMIMLPTAFMIDPILLAGFYFMFTSKFRLRLDLAVLIILALCFWGLYAITHPAAVPSIKGDATLSVTVVTDKSAPVANLEVDLGEKTGPPPDGGTANTDDSGVATFSVKPGKYVIYFNGGNFPANLVYPGDGQPVEVSSGAPAEQKIILKTK